jgi:hypothetical protein
MHTTVLSLSVSLSLRVNSLREQTITFYFEQSTKQILHTKFGVCSAAATAAADRVIFSEKEKSSGKNQIFVHSICAKRTQNMKILLSD